MQSNGPWPPPYPQQSPYAPQPSQGYVAQPGYIADPYGGAQMMYRANAFVPFGATAGPLPNPVYKTLKLVAAIGQLVAMFGAIGLLVAGGVMENGGETLSLLGGLGLALWYVLLLAHAILNLLWFHAFWSWVPPEQRWTNMWRKYISPGTFVGFMFIPYFNLYWLFVTYLGAADVMERMRVQYPTDKPPAKSIAIVSLVGAFLFFPAAPVFQYFYQRHLEQMATDMTRSMPAR